MKLVILSGLIIFLFPFIVEGHSDYFTCLGNDSKKITFYNAPNEEVPDLYKVRIMQGAYASQWALEFAAFIFMREKLGIPVSFYPDDNPSIPWAAHANKSDGQKGYPGNYWEWIKRDYMDLQMEIWPIQEFNGEGKEYYARGEVVDGGFVGVYGETGFYIPKYLYENESVAIVPSTLRTDTVLQQKFISAAHSGIIDYYSEYNHTTQSDCKWDFTRFNSSINSLTMRNTVWNITEWEQHGAISFLNKYFSPWILNIGYNFTSSNMTGCSFNFTLLSLNYNDNTKTSVSLSTYIYFTPYTSKFDIPDGTRPAVWGSAEYYGISQTGYNLTKNVLGPNWDFVCTKSESKLAAMVNDLYSKRLPFIAMIYTPDNNFATSDPLNGTIYQDFEMVAFERNPDQSPNDPCYIAGKCQYPVEALKKAASPLLNTKERFPEAYQFFLQYYLPASQIGLLMNNYLALSNTSLNESWKWLNASCSWLKDSRSTQLWNNSLWLVNINRTKCIPQCGIEYVVSSNGDEPNIFIGGKCDYYTGECVCEYPELDPTEQCKVSCPGLLGPYQDLNNITDYYFEWCGGHGICNTKTLLCSCSKGYGGNGCTIEYSKYEFPIALGIIFILFSSILVIISILCIVWLRMNATYKTVKALSVDMTTIFSVGLVGLGASNIALVTNVNSVSCVAWQWLFGLGGILAIMSPLLKAYRVSRVFHGGKMLRAVKITDKMLMGTLTKAAIFELLLCGAFTFSHEYFGGTNVEYNDILLRIEQTCNNNPITDYISKASLLYFFIMLCSLTYYSYGTRRALSVFKESTCAYFSSFLALFCALITVVFNMATNDPTFQNAIFASAIIIVVTAVLGLFYGTRVYAFFNEPENRNVTDMRSPTATSTSFTSSVMKPGPEAAKS